MTWRRNLLGLLLGLCLLSLHATASAHVERALAGPGTAAGSALLHWSWDPLVLSMLAVSAALYLIGTTRLWHASHSGSGIRKWQAACFWGGWLTLIVALVSPLDPLGAVLFSAHMVQHELLMLVAAPLLVLGRPLAAFVWALPVSWRRRLGSATKSTPVDHLWGSITHPLSAWTIHALVLWVWHVPPFFQASIVNSTVHTFQHSSFLFAALLFWWSAFQARQRHGGNGVAILYLLTTALHTALLGALLTFSLQLWYPVYAATTTMWGFTAIEDQQLGGLIMWVPGGLSYLFAALWLAARLLEGGESGPEKQAQK